MPRSPRQCGYEAHAARATYAVDHHRLLSLKMGHRPPKTKQRPPRQPPHYTPARRVGNTRKADLIEAEKDRYVHNEITVEELESRVERILKGEPPVESLSAGRPQPPFKLDWARV